VESESDAAGAVPPEQDLTEALLSLSWPLPRTVQDADAALTRLEEVKAVLTRLEQQSVGTDAWWAGQVDGLATQMSFVLEWWRPVLRDPDLDWTLNHQAHLTADLATLASAGARLLDQLEPSVTEEAAAAAHARRVEQEKRWGPAAVPPLTGPKPHAPGARPQPPAAVFGEGANPEPSQKPATAPPPAPAPVPASAAFDAPSAPAPAPAAFDAPPVAAPPSIPAQQSADVAGAPLPPVAAAPVQAPAPEASPGSARHRRPAYDFDDPRHPAPGSTPPAAAPSSGPPPRSPLVPGPGFGGPPQGRTLAPGTYPPPASSGPGPGPFGFSGEDEDDEPDSLVPTGLGLRRHQRRLLIQTGAILGAIGVLCWWAVYTLSSPSHASAAGDATHTAETATATASSGHSTAAGGLTTNHSASPTPSTPTTSETPGAAPSTATSSVPDATTVSSVRVTLLGGSSTVPQVVALITVNTADTGQVTVTGSYYGASGSKQVAAETERWTLSGKTSYQYSVPIANSAYCGTEFHFTLSAGGHSESDETAPGC